MQTRKTVYLDHAASSPLRQQARDALLAYEEAPYAGANPNSLHTMGRQAARALDGARAELARCLGGRIRPADVAFTSGGTESNNLAVLGMAEGARLPRPPTHLRGPLRHRARLHPGPRAHAA